MPKPHGIGVGAGQRLVWAATGRVIHRWHLGSGVQRNREHPDTFPIPAEYERQAVVPGMSVKLMFEMKNGDGDRMWVVVTDIKKRKLVGRLTNMPFMIPRLMPGDEIKFKHEHIIDIWYDDDAGHPAGDRGEDPNRLGARAICQGCNCHGEHEQELSPGPSQPDPSTSPPPCRE